METSFKFTMPMRVDVVEEKGEQKIFLEGFLSTSDQDLVNDIVTKGCLESMKRQILERNIKLDIEHESFRGKSFEEKEINKTLIPAGRFIDAVVESLGNSRWGLRVKAVLNRFHPRYSEIKGNVMERMLDAYSIAFIATAHRDVIINGKSVRYLEDLALLNAALTGNPINTEANSQVFLKSIQSLEDYEMEKKSNPETEKLLEVKCSNSKENDKLNAKGGLKMQTPTETQEKAEGVHGGTYGKEGGNAPGKEATDTTSTVSAKTPKEDETTSTTTAEKKSEELKSRVDALEAEIKQLKAQPISKSPGANLGTVKQMEFEGKSVESKSVGPLDFI